MSIWLLGATESWPCHGASVSSAFRPIIGVVLQAVSTASQMKGTWILFLESEARILMEPLPSSSRPASGRLFPLSRKASFQQSFKSIYPALAPKSWFPAKLLTFLKTNFARLGIRTPEFSLRILAFSNSPILSRNSGADAGFGRLENVYNV